MTTSDKIEYVIINGIPYVPHPAKAEDARVYRSQSGSVRVYVDRSGLSTHFNPSGKIIRDPPIWHEDDAAKHGVLLTGPEAAEYVAAAREGRDAAWPPSRECDCGKIESGRHHQDCPAIQPKVESEWPKCIGKNGRVYWVFFGPNKEDGVWTVNLDSLETADAPYSSIVQMWGLITDPTLRAKYISAAEAFRARESDPWPHWYLRRCDGYQILVRHDSEEDGVVYHSDEDGNFPLGFDEKTRKACGCYERVPSPEAAALLAKWEANRQAKLDSSTPQPELPTAERGVEHPYAIAARVVARWKLSESEQLHHLEKRIAGAIEEDRQARSGERGG